MMANALDINGAKKVFILGRRLEKLQEVASQAVSRISGCGNRYLHSN